MAIAGSRSPKRGISRSEVIEQFARSLEAEHSSSERPAVTQVVDSPVTAILESITDAFVAFDRDWHYTYVNHAAAQILHKLPEELIGKHVWNDVFPELVGALPTKQCTERSQNKFRLPGKNLGSRFNVGWK